MCRRRGEKRLAVSFARARIQVEMSSLEFRGDARMWFLCMNIIKGPRNIPPNALLVPLVLFSRQIPRAFCIIQVHGAGDTSLALLCWFGSRIQVEMSSLEFRGDARACVLLLNIMFGCRNPRQMHCMSSLYCFGAGFCSQTALSRSCVQLIFATPRFFNISP